MGEITVYFIGICTHMQWPEEFGSEPGFRHRVVLVNGSERREIHQKSIASHYATLSIAADDLVMAGVPAQAGTCEPLVWNLDGVTIEIANATGDLRYHESYECCVPHLKVLTPPLPQPARRVVTDALPMEASCYFEVTAGEMRAGLTTKGAAVGVLTVRTRGDFPIVRLRRFDGKALQDVPLRDGARIAVANVAETGDDDDNDFLLHYKTAEYVPPDAQIPTEPATCCKVLPPDRMLSPKQDVGPGCSNSNFP